MGSPVAICSRVHATTHTDHARICLHDGQPHALIIHGDGFKSLQPDQEVCECRLNDGPIFGSILPVQALPEDKSQSDFPLYVWWQMLFHDGAGATTTQSRRGLWLFMNVNDGHGKR